MTTHAGSSPTISFDRSSLGRPQAWEIVWRRLVYPGEVIVEDALAGGDFDALTGDATFRIILATRGLKPRARPRDARTVLAVPRFRFDPVEEMQRASGSAANALAIDSRDSQLRHLVQMEQTSEWHSARLRISRGYAEGRIYAHETVTLSVSDVFAGDSLEASIDELASRLLSAAFPNAPVDPTEFPATLDTAAIEKLYAGLFQQDRTALETVQGFGPGLGVVARGDTEFDGSKCPVHDIIDGELSSRDGTIPSAELIEILVHGHGLVRPLAFFYLLSFVMHARAEVDLTDGHDVRTPAGGRFHGDRITWDLLSEVEFSESLFRGLGTLRLRPSPTWNTMIPYATALIQGLEPDAVDDVSLVTEQDVMQHASALAEEVAKTRDKLAGLAEAFPNTGEISTDLLQSLAEVGGAADPVELYDAAREHFGGPSRFGEALEAFKRTRQLANLVDEITQAKLYLGSMSFGIHHRGLALERDSVAARIDPGSLNTNPSLWGALRVSVSRLKERYARTYVAHHGQYHRGAVSLRVELEAREARVNALARFNEISDLGAPVGAEVQSGYTDLLNSLRRCSADDNVVLDSVPYCRNCQLPLAEDVPAQAIDELFDAMDTAMREYNRRLSSQAVRRVLANQSKEQLDIFIDLLQVADPSALEYALDDDVIEFLREFMR